MLAHVLLALLGAVGLALGLLWLAVRARRPRLWSFLHARFARGQYLGLHLTIGLVVSLAALWLFGDVTEGVVDHEALTAADPRVASWFRAHATPLGDSVALFFSAVGSPVSMAVLAAAVALVLTVKRYWITLTGSVAAFAGAALLTFVLKFVVQRPRPPDASRFPHTTSFSYPSGHALISLVAFGMLGYLLVTHWAPGRRHRWLALGLLATLVVVIGLSRLYLVVHYLSDVAAGYAAGLVWLAACVTGIDTALERRALEPSGRRGTGARSGTTGATIP